MESQCLSVWFQFGCVVEFAQSMNAVALKNCEVKCTQKGEKLEIKVTKHTEAEKSDKVFAVDKVAKVTALGELKKLVSYQRVTVEVKALCVGDVMEVSGAKKKQDIVTGDSSGSARLTVWEGDIGKVEDDGSYGLIGMTVREYQGERFISTSKENSQIEAMSEIGDVKEESEEENNSSDQGCPHDVWVVDRTSTRLRVA